MTYDVRGLVAALRAFELGNLGEVDRRRLCRLFLDVPEADRRLKSAALAYRAAGLLEGQYVALERLPDGHWARP